MRGSRRRGAVAAAALIALAGACASPRGGRSRTGQTSCTNELAGFEVSYPAAWHHADCERFDPEPIDRAALRDPAIAIGTEAADLDAFVRALQGPAQDLLERRRLEIAGRPAMRLRMRTTRDSHLLPPGTLITEYVVDLGGRVLVARTSGRAGAAFDAAEKVLDGMIFTLRLR